jgi:protein-tyrosine-phosphatase
MSIIFTGIFKLSPEAKFVIFSTHSYIWDHVVFRDILESYKPDIILMWLWFWDFKNIVPQLLVQQSKDLRPEAKLILFSDDVHSKREQQLAEQHKGYSKYQHFKRRSIRMKNIELQLYKQFDAVVAITSADSSDIVHLDPEALSSKVFFVNFVASPWDTPRFKEVRSWDDRKNLIFVGNGENPTNVYSLNWYLSEIAQHIENGIPGVRCYVVGPGWDEFQKVHEGSSKYLEFKGPLSSEAMTDLINTCRVFVSPIIASTGINTKNVLALSHQIPLVTTPAGKNFAQDYFIRLYER